MYYIHTMTTILRYIRAFVATAYFNQFIKPNDSIINRCKYRRSRRVNADEPVVMLTIEWSTTTNPGKNSIIPER